MPAGDIFSSERCGRHAADIEELKKQRPIQEERMRTIEHEINGKLDDIRKCVTTLKVGGGWVRGVLIGIATSITTAGVLVTIAVAAGKL